MFTGQRAADGFQISGVPGLGQTKGRAHPGLGTGPRCPSPQPSAWQRLSNRARRVLRDKDSPWRTCGIPVLAWIHWPGLHMLTVSGHMAGGSSWSFEAHLLSALPLSSGVTRDRSLHLSEPSFLIKNTEVTMAYSSLGTWTPAGKAHGRDPLMNGGAVSSRLGPQLGHKGLVAGLLSGQPSPPPPPLPPPHQHQSSQGDNQGDLGSQQYLEEPPPNWARVPLGDMSRDRLHGANTHHVAWPAAFLRRSQTSFAGNDRYGPLPQHTIPRPPEFPEKFQENRIPLTFMEQTLPARYCARRQEDSSEPNRGCLPAALAGANL